ncbi:hypothetical protein GCM10009730_63480 [Streptomyces albidochromogenes]
MDAGQRPLAGLRLREVQYLHLVGPAAYDDLDATGALGRQATDHQRDLDERVDGRGLPGVTAPSTLYRSASN